MFQILLALKHILHHIRLLVLQISLFLFLFINMLFNIIAYIPVPILAAYMLYAVVRFFLSKPVITTLGLSSLNIHSISVFTSLVAVAVNALTTGLAGRLFI